MVHLILTCHTMLRINKFIGFVFLLASSFFVVPKELVHELAYHDDTADLCADSDDPAVGNEHHHCEILQLCLPPYTATDEIAGIDDFTRPSISALIDSRQPTFELRGCFVIRGPPFLT